SGILERTEGPKRPIFLPDFDARKFFFIKIFNNLFTNWVKNKIY
ncbi:hypothetical protein LCGC14_2844110, partial [marine sediment metagenome]